MQNHYRSNVYVEPVEKTERICLDGAGEDESKTEIGRQQPDRMKRQETADDKRREY